GLLFLIVFVGLSALSSLLNRKKKNDSTPKQQSLKPAPPQQNRKYPIPGYARKATQAPTTSQTRTPTTTQRPGPTAQHPTPSSQRPTSGTRQPQQHPQQRKPRPVVHPIPEQARARPIHATPIPKTATTKKRQVAPKTKTPAQIAAKKQMMSTSEASKLKKSMTTGTGKTSLSAIPASDNIQLGLDQQDSLVRAILYAEILDKPMALRRSGSHDFLDF
ncbi:MAG: hypothetical protein GY869_26135, partial [Planctomycetes bacterium]|nr:hypothetical protein [Planctomycetota bacterium]